MGLTKKLSERFQQYKANRKEEKTFRSEIQAESKAEFRRGLKEGKIKSAYQRGINQGSGRHVQGVTGRGVMGKVAGFGEGVGKGLKQSDEVMGWSGGGGGFNIGGGLGLGGGFGGEKPKRKGGKATTIRTGGRTITIREQDEEHHERESDPWFG